MPLYVFVILNFGIVFSLCFICELQPLPEERSQPNQENDPKTSIPMFYVYIFQLLFGRALPMILFSVLVFYPADFPTKFFCRLSPPS